MLLIVCFCAALSALYDLSLCLMSRRDCAADGVPIGVACPIDFVN